MYDSIDIPCPDCGTVFEAQSKSGSCVTAEYTIYGVPQDVAEDINRHAPFTCKCGCSFRINETQMYDLFVYKSNQYLNLSNCIIKSNDI